MLPVDTLGYYPDIYRGGHKIRINNFSEVLGEALRDARRASGLTLQNVEQRSREMFKPSVVGGYERGERAISLERFCGLAAIYGASPEQVLAEVLSKLSPEARKKLRINVNGLSMVQAEIGRVVAEFIHVVKAKRGDYLTDVITLRSGDVEALAQVARLTPKRMMSTLRPALVNTTAKL